MRWLEGIYSLPWAANKIWALKKQIFVLSAAEWFQDFVYMFEVCLCVVNRGIFIICHKALGEQDIDSKYCFALLVSPCFFSD